MGGWGNEAGETEVEFLEPWGTRETTAEAMMKVSSPAWKHGADELPQVLLSQGPFP